jgi:hypothetical protein
VTALMTAHPQEIAKRIQDLTVRFGAEVMRSLQRYNELLQRVAGGELDEAAVGDAYVRFMRDESERYFRGVADASAGYYDALLELSAIYNPPFFEHAFNQRRRQPEPGSRHQGIIELGGSLGDEAASTFRVVNTSDDSDEVAFAVSEFSGPPGTAPFRPPLRLQPPRFVLRRFESQLVSVRLPLVDGLFVPDQRYTATLTVRKHEAFDLAIVVVAGARPDAALTVRSVAGEAASE